MPRTRNPADGTGLHYEVHGDGPPLVLIMGLGGDTAAWGMQIAAFARQHRVIAFDNRGAGASDKPDTPYDMSTMAADTLAVMDAAGVERAAVLGVSMGGIIAQALYERAPERVTGLVLAATGPPVHSRHYVAPAAEVGATLRLDRHEHPRREIIAAMAAIFYHPRYRERVPDLADRLLAFEEDGGQPPHAYHRQLEAVMADTSTADRPEDVAVPALVIHGDGDRVWPVANARYLAGSLPDARLTIVPEAGHMVMLEQSRAFNSAVLEFTTDRRTDAR